MPARALVVIGCWAGCAGAVGGVAAGVPCAGADGDGEGAACDSMAIVGEESGGVESRAMETRGGGGADGNCGIRTRSSTTVAGPAFGDATTDCSARKGNCVSSNTT